MLEARHAEEGDNLARKQELIARAQAVAEAAPGDGGWGKAIAEIKELQRRVEGRSGSCRDATPTRCTARSAARATRCSRSATRRATPRPTRTAPSSTPSRREFAAVIAGGDDVVARAIAGRAKARELGGLAAEIDEMVRHVLATQADSVKGTELDPGGAAREARQARRQGGRAAAEAAGSRRRRRCRGAAQAGDARERVRRAPVLGRDPIEVIDELRAQWADIGPLSTTRTARCGALRGDVQTRARRGGRRQAGARRASRATRTLRARRPPAPQALRRAADDLAASRGGGAPRRCPPSSEAITQPAKFEPAAAPSVPAPPVVAEAAPVAEPPRRKSSTTLPPMDELDTGWDMPRRRSDRRKAEAAAPPSASEMAGDSATGGDGIDEPGWD